MNSAKIMLSRYDFRFVRDFGFDVGFCFVLRDLFHGFVDLLPGLALYFFGLRAGFALGFGAADLCAGFDVRFDGAAFAGVRTDAVKPG